MRLPAGSAHGLGGTVQVMAGRDERHGRDLDDWFDEPQAPSARRLRANVHRAEVGAPRADGDDWVGGGDRQPQRGPRSGFIGVLSEPRRAMAAAVALVVLLVLGLALGGVFDSATPRPAAGETAATHAGATTAPSTATQPRSTATAAPSGPLKPGDQGSEVKVLQRALASLGYSPGAVDGSYGASTERAVAGFQSSSKLTSDGILGPQTLLALRTALKNY